MHYKNEETFRAAFRAEGAHGAYLLYGSEEYLIDAWKGRITKAFADAGAFNLQKLDGRSLSGDALYDAIEALPLMAAQKCVVVEDLDLSKLPPKELEKVLDAVADPPPDCLLVMTGKAAFDPKSATAKKLLKLIGEKGVVVELGSRGAAGLLPFLKAEAKRNGCELSTELARRIIELCGTDMNTLHQEMAKICANAGYGSITAAHIHAVATPRIEARVFDLSKAILAGQPRRAMSLLADLFELREAPIAILSTLIMSYVDQYRARIARDSGVSQKGMAERFGYKSEYRVRNAYGSRLSAAALRQALEALYDCDLRMKSTGIDDKVLLEQTVVRLFRVNGVG
jgi:DNA polymerase-3 subunit delta